MREGSGPARLLDMVQGRSKAVFTTWLEQQSTDFRDGIEVVAMDGFTGFKTAAAEELPDAVTVMDPFHVVRLAGDALDRCRRRVQQDTCGHRGRKGDPLYATRRTLHTGADLLTDKQTQRLQALFTGDEHVEVEATWGIYQRMIAAYRQPDRARARELMQALVESVSAGVPAALTELVTLGRTLKKRAADVLAYFDRPGTSNGPTEAINGRLEHLRGTALGFRNLIGAPGRAQFCSRALSISIVNLTMSASGVFSRSSKTPEPRLRAIPASAATASSARNRAIGSCVAVRR